MKYLYTLCIFLGLSTHQLHAQTYTFNWATSVLLNWVGSIFTGDANNVNSSSVNATISVSSNQANAFTSFADFTSPSVGSSPFTTDYWSNLPNLAVGVNFTDKNNYADITINFSSAVKNVTFNIADIDKASWTSDTYFDEVVVTGTNSGAPVSNPSLSKLNNWFNSSIVISGNTARANTNDYTGGNSASSWLEQNGTVVVDFGNTLLTAVTIRFRSNAASQNNPAAQAIGIGNISFQRAVVLPLSLTSFNGAINNNSVKLNWSGAQEEDLDKYIVEKSTDAVNWSTLTTVMASGTSTNGKEYNTVDLNAVSINYYRLKQVERNGNFSYSQVIRIRKGEQDKLGIKLYPNPVTSNATVTINSENKLAAHIKIYNQFGMQLQHLQRSLIAGSNNITVPGISALPAGSYIVVVEDEKFNKIGTTQFVKQ
jgi:hypothetical protein